MFRPFLTSLLLAFIFAKPLHAMEEPEDMRWELSPSPTITPTSHIVSNLTDYVKGEFLLKKQDRAIYTHSHKPAMPKIIQSVLIDEDRKISQLPSYEENLLLRVEDGEDGRKRILSPSEWPYSFHAQLGLFFSDGREHGGSGVLVGPHHILTAAHNVFSHDRTSTKEWATNIVVRLALNDRVAHFGELSAVKFYTFEEYIKDRDQGLDIALIILNKSIGLETGWVGLLADEDAPLMSDSIHVTGYPGDKGFKQLWTMSHRIKQLEQERIFYDIDTYAGQSGGAIWINRDSSVYLGPHVIGVHARGEEIPDKGNSGVRLSHEKFNYIIKWISETAIITQIFDEFCDKKISLKVATGDAYLGVHKENETVVLSSETSWSDVGIYWRPIKLEDGSFAFQFLDSQNSKGKYLDAFYFDGSVYLSPQTNGGYTGTHWKPIKDGDGNYFFQCIASNNPYFVYLGVNREMSIWLSPDEERLPPTRWYSEKQGQLVSWKMCIHSD